MSWSRNTHGVCDKLEQHVAQFFIVQIIVMEELKLFQSPIFGQVRTVVINGQVMFAATDVAKCLGYANPRDAISKHCKSDGVAFCDGVVKTGQRKDGTIYEQTGEIKIITKGNLIRLVANSELPQAEEVESWIFDEVIPTVLETGGYIATKQDDTPEEIMARALTIAQATKKYLFLFGDLYNCCTFAVRQFYYHIRIGDFLCPILKYCLKYKQRFLRTYSPQSRYGTVASWRNSLLSLFINF